jgi:hypothetical protein
VALGVFSYHLFRAFWFESLQIRPGRWLKSRPKNVYEKYEYGFDAQNRVRVEREYFVFENPYTEVIQQRFFRWSESSFEAQFFHHHENDPISLIRGNLNAGKVTRLLGWYNTSVAFHRIAWQDEQPLQKRSYRADVVDGRMVGGLAPDRIHIATYGTDGKLDELLLRSLTPQDEITERGRTEFKRLPPKQTLALMTEQLREPLTKAILQEIKRAAVSEPVYCIALLWAKWHENCLPPSVGIGLASDRDRWLREPDKDVGYFLWNPAESRSLYEVNDDSISELTGLINQTCMVKQSWRDASDMLNQIALDLTDFDFGTHLQRTDDFVVFVTDLELQDLNKNMRKTVAPELYKQFMKKKWIP